MKLINNMLACEKGKALGTRLEVAYMYLAFNKVPKKRESSKYAKGARKLGRRR